MRKNNKKQFNVLYFLQYHNAALIILVIAVLVLGGTVFAQTETGKNVIGRKQEEVVSVDNKALLSANLDNFDMQFQITDIKTDELANASSTPKNYYITYIYRDLVLKNNKWQWAEGQRQIDISQKDLGSRDLGIYLAEELKEIAFWRKKELKEKQAKAKQVGPTGKKVVTKYSGLIGRVLSAKNAVFSGYDPVVKPKVHVIARKPASLDQEQAQDKKKQPAQQQPDTLAYIYQNWLQNNPQKVEQLNQNNQNNQGDAK